MDITGRRNILNIPISVPFGDLIIDQRFSTHDYIDVSNRSFSTINLRLSDSHNNTIDLNNSDWSCSIIFISI